MLSSAHGPGQWISLERSHSVGLLAWLCMRAAEGGSPPSSPPFSLSGYLFVPGSPSWWGKLYEERAPIKRRIT
ncbi:hypothetical protein FJTKL_02642 [Diaporthe vaccinii]|uniref:Secreted protein n=1 Tax=Diaporthe vaccinii TaxID=105482 RepID=A0ABR4DXL1_9PEZI